MKISAQIIADSHDGLGNRITTILCTFPRFILAELNTHRMFSRNSASSRAIPFNTMLKSVQENPFIPMAWQADHKGMQGTSYIDPREDAVILSGIENNWLLGRDYAIEQARVLNYSNVTKQLCNRMLEPYMYHTALITSTEWENFFALRCPQYVTPVGGKDDQGNDWTYRSKKDCIEGHSDSDNLEKLENFTTIDWLKINKGQGEIHIMELAEQIWDAMNESDPNLLEEGEWHVPYAEKISEMDLLLGRNDAWEAGMGFIDVTNGGDGVFQDYAEQVLVKTSTVMAARTSYTIPEGELSDWSGKKYLIKYDELKGSRHASPFEHCAKRMTKYEYYNSGIQVPNDPDVGSGIIHTGWCRNFRGFIQLRALEGL